MTRSKELPADEFAFVWAAAILFQYISNIDWISSINRDPFAPVSLLQSLLVLSACALLLFPSSMKLLLSTAALQLLHVLIILPILPNHRLFTGMIHLGFFLAVLVAYFRDRHLNAQTVWELLAPQVRWMMILLYFYAALSKTNTDYLIPSGSCATDVFNRIKPLLPLDIPSAISDPAVMWGSLLFEWALPVLLFLPLTRSVTVLIGLIFHLTISFDSLHHYVDFSSLATAGLLSFSTRPILPRQVTKPLAWIVVLGVVTCIYFASKEMAPDTIFVFMRTRDITWFIYSFCLISLYVVRREKGEGEQASGSLALANPLLIIAPLLVLINGATPYVGLKTKGAWTMYGNLRLEGENPNHLFFGRGLDIQGELRSPIRILSTTNVELQLNYVNTNYDIVPFELRRIFAKDQGGITTFEWKGKTYHDYPHGQGGDILSTPPSWIAQKLQWFRPADRQNPVRCVW